MSELYQNIDDDTKVKAITIEEVFSNISKQKDEQVSTNFIEVNEQEGDEQEGDEQEGDEQEGDEQEGDEQEGDEQEGDEQEGDKQEGDEQEGDEQEGDEQEDDEQEDDEQEDEQQEEDQEEENQEDEENTDTNQNKGFIYLVSIDNNPVTYTYSRDDAEKIMWKYAKDLYHDYIPTDKVFYITQKTINSISIVGSYKFSIISYESTYHVIKYTKVYKY